MGIPLGPKPAGHASGGGRAGPGRGSVTGHRWGGGAAGADRPPAEQRGHDQPAAPPPAPPRPGTGPTGPGQEPTPTPPLATGGPQGDDRRIQQRNGGNSCYFSSALHLFALADMIRGTLQCQHTRGPGGCGPGRCSLLPIEDYLTSRDWEASNRAFQALMGSDLTATERGLLAPHDRTTRGDDPHCALLGLAQIALRHARDPPRWAAEHSWAGITATTVRECDGRRLPAPGEFNRSTLLTQGVPLALSVRRFDNEGVPRATLPEMILRALRPRGVEDGGVIARHERVLAAGTLDPDHVCCATIELTPPARSTRTTSAARPSS